MITLLENKVNKSHNSKQQIKWITSTTYLKFTVLANVNFSNSNSLFSFEIVNL